MILWICPNGSMGLQLFVSADRLTTRERISPCIRAEWRWRATGTVIEGSSHGPGSRWVPGLSASLPPPRIGSQPLPYTSATRRNPNADCVPSVCAHPEGLVAVRGRRRLCGSSRVRPPLARTAGCGDLATSDRSGTNSSTSFRSRSFDVPTLVGIGSLGLTRSAFEVLACVASKQPISQAEIDRRCHRA